MVSGQNGLLLLSVDYKNPSNQTICILNSSKFFIKFLFLSFADEELELTWTVIREVSSG